MKPVRSLSLRFWLPLLLSVTFALLLFTSIWIEHQQLETNLIQSSLREVTRDMSSLQRQLSYELDVDDFKGAERTLSSRGVNVNYRTLLVTDDKGQILYATRFALKGKRIVDVLSDIDKQLFLQLQHNNLGDVNYDSERQQITAHFPLTLKRSVGELRPLRTGSLFAIYDLREDLALVWGQTWRDNLPVWLILIIAMAALLGFLQHFVTRPTKYLASAALAFAKGETGEFRRLPGKGELASLGESLYQMSTQIGNRFEQHRQAEQALRDSREQLLIAQHVAHLGFFYWNLDTDQITLSDEACQILGLGQGTVETSAELISGSVHPEDLERVEKSIQMVRNGEDAYIIDHRIVRPNGEVRWVQAQAVLLGASNDEQSATLLGTVLDINRRKQAEERWKESEEKFSKAFHDHPAPMEIVNLKTGERIVCNRSLCKLVGVEKEVLENSNLFENNKLANPSTAKQLADRVLKDGYIRNHHIEAVNKSNEPLHLLISAAMLDTGDGNLAVLSMIDITERLELEGEMRKLALAVEQSPDSIIITNTQAEIEYVNKAFVDASGYSKEELLGSNPRILKSGKTPPETYKDLWSSLKRGQAWKGELFNRRKDGSEFIEWAHIVPLSQPDGSITHYVGVKQDITEKKRLATELEAHRHHLEELVEERTAQLAEARKKAETANQAKSAFLANMSHEIRTPMSAIVGLTHLLQREQPTAQQAARLSKIDTSAAHLLAIINDILDLSKIEAGKLTLEQADFRLDIIFDQVRSLFKDQLAASGLHMEVESDDVPAWLCGDATRLRQALINYVGNAIKFTRHGRITLRVHKVQEARQGMELCFEVTDTGIGIDADTLKGLFEAFEQADVSTTREYGGTGLGLAVTKRLVHLMGGETGAQSTPGEGSTFWFTAWLGHASGVQTATDHEVLEDAEVQLHDQYAGTRILLVEDNAINCEVAMSLLSGAGLVVDTAMDGLEAIECARSTVYALILMDVQMPRMDGMQATREIRTLDGYAAVPVLAMSANVFIDDREAYMAAGMDDFVAKPVEPDNLFSTILKWLSNSGPKQ